jgi:hypothetical protein
MSLIIIQIQPSEAFDRLSILEVKKFFSPTVEQKIKLQNQITELEYQINDSIGYDLAKKIYCSEFYTDLYNANFNVFTIIDKQNKEIKNNTIENLIKIGIPAVYKIERLAELGLLANNENQKRFNAKIKLQNEFFDSEINEIKIGYE